MKSGNPALRFSHLNPDREMSGPPMTWKGTTDKTFLLLALTFTMAAVIWFVYHVPGLEGFYDHPDAATLIAILGTACVSSLCLCFIICFFTSSAQYLAAPYALVKGLTVGSLSVLFDGVYPGIAAQAFLGTIGVFVFMLAAYRYEWIKVTEKFANFVIACTIGIGVIYLAGWCGLRIPYIHESGPVGIGFSLFVVAIASFNLLLDFEEVSDGIRLGAPKKDEWFAAFSLLLTMVWLYLELLRLLWKIRDE